MRRVKRRLLKQSITLIAVTDIHGYEDGMEEVRRKVRVHKPDLLIVCGDITNFGPSSIARDFLDSIKIPVLAVPGNCDPPEVLVAIEESKAEPLHRRGIDFKGQHFVGLGGAPQTPFGTPMEFSEQRIYEFLDEVMEKDGILVTHAPAWGKNDRARGAHLGSNAILSIVEKYKPKLAISGHIHEARGIVEHGGTTFVNPGPAKNGYAALIQVKGARVKVELLDDTR